MTTEIKKELGRYQKQLASASPQESLRWAVEHFGERAIALASSLGAEDQVLTDMLVKVNPHVHIFTLDTGRLHQETYDVMSETMKRYGLQYDVYFPQTSAVEKMERDKGPNLFYESMEARKTCCAVRKLEPLQRALTGLSAWICGLRREQAVSRAAVEKIEWDEAHQLVKLNPLVDWTEKQVWDYVREHGVPANKLHDQGYPSIGCAPCTRAVKSGEDIRAGRWWWETPEKRECGLHCKKS